MSTAEVLNMMDFRGKQAVRHTEFSLSCSAEAAFFLFTPEGGRSWVENWEPTPVYPEQIAFEPNTVFEVFQAGERSIWTIVAADSTARMADYVCFVFTSRIARIRVQVKPEGRENCKVAVEYAVTGFTDAGDHFVDKFTDEAFHQKMQIWQRDLSRVIRRK